MRETASQFSHVWRQLDLREIFCSWNVGEFFPTAEEQVGEDSHLGTPLRGKGFLCMYGGPDLIFGEMRLGADRWVGRGVRSSVGAVVAMSLAKWVSGLSAPAVVPVDQLPIGLRPR